MEIRDRLAILALVVAVACSNSGAPPSGGDPYSLGRTTDGDCVLRATGADRSSVIPPKQNITYFLDDGRALLIDGEQCFLETTQDVVLAPVTPTASVPEYFKLFWGAFSELAAPNSYEDIAITLHLQSSGLSAPPGASYSAWLGLQPPLDLKNPDDPENRWGNLAYRPTLQIGDLGGFTRVNEDVYNEALPYVFNTFCDASIATCPIDGPSNIPVALDGEIKMQQRVYHTGPANIFPDSWIAETAFGESSALFVVPDKSVRKIFEDPGFCDGHPCRLPVGLLEQEIRARETVELADIPSLFPKEIRFAVERITKTDGDQPIDWSFPKGFEITGTLVADKIILSIADLETYMAGLDPSSPALPPLKCILAIFSDMQTSRELIEQRDTFVWTLSDEAPAACE